MSKWELKTGSRNADPLNQFASLFYDGEELFRFAAESDELIWTAENGWVEEKNK